MDAIQGNILAFLTNQIVYDFRPQDQGDLIIRLFGNPPRDGASPTIYQLLKTISTNTGGGGGGGDATAANQVLEIAELTVIKNNSDYIPNTANNTANANIYLQQLHQDNVDIENGFLTPLYTELNQFRVDFANMLASIPGGIPSSESSVKSVSDAIGTYGSADSNTVLGKLQDVKNYLFAIAGNMPVTGFLSLGTEVFAGASMSDIKTFVDAFMGLNPSYRFVSLSVVDNDPSTGSPQALLVYSHP